MKYRVTSRSHKVVTLNLGLAKRYCTRATMAVRPPGNLDRAGGPLKQAQRSSSRAVNKQAVGAKPTTYRPRTLS